MQKISCIMQKKICIILNNNVNINVNVNLNKNGNTTEPLIFKNQGFC